MTPRFFNARSPVVVEGWRLRRNHWWWHNIEATHAWVFRLRHGYWPTYWYWRHPERCQACEMKGPEPWWLTPKHTCDRRER